MFIGIEDKMNEEKIKAHLEEALDVETFDVLDFVEGVPAATDSVLIYTDIARSRRVSELLAQRAEILRKREGDNGADDLSIADEDQDTPLDDEINELFNEMAPTGLTFEIQSVAPKLVKAIEKNYKAKERKSWTDEQKQEHDQARMADILSRGIVKVVRGDGATDTTPWDGERLLAFEDRVYGEQATILVSALYDMIFTGQAFQDAVTVDF